MLTQILAETPKWVFPIFFVLVWYGYLQSRTRQASVARVLMLPAIMIVLSLGGVLSSFGPTAAALLSWAGAFALAILINLVVKAPAGVVFDPATRKFHLPGSWVPLALMMVIYFAKYTVGATTALHPEIIATTGFTTTLSLIFGLLSGTFFARFLRIWSHRRDAIPAAAESTWSPTA